MCEPSTVIWLWESCNGILEIGIARNYNTFAFQISMFVRFIENYKKMSFLRLWTNFIFANVVCNCAWSKCDFLTELFLGQIVTCGNTPTISFGVLPSLITHQNFCHFPIWRIFALFWVNIWWDVIVQIFISLSTAILCFLFRPYASQIY